MKYIYYIFFILFALSIATGVVLYQDKEVKSESILTVNGLRIHPNEMKRLIKPGSDFELTAEDIQAAITRILLIQEAQRKEIHKEDKFRKSIQDYYEQSLVNTLINRTLNDFKVVATKPETDRFMELSDKTLYFTKFIFDSEINVKKGPSSAREKEEREENFDSIPGSLQYMFVNLKPGDLSMPYLRGSMFVIYRLDRVETNLLYETGNIDRNFAETTIQDEKESKAWQDWTDNLRSNAVIIQNNQTYRIAGKDNP